MKIKKINMNINIKAAVVLLLGLSLFVSAAPQQDGRYLNREITYTLNDDGSWIRDYQHQLRYGSYFATRRLGETFITYNPAYQKLEVVKSVTTMKDGKRVPIPANALNEVLPRDAGNQADFSHLREMVVTHTGLERGAVVDLHYRIDTKAGFMPYFSATEFADDQLPVDYLKVRVSVPASLELRYRVFQAEADPTIEPAGNRQVYTFVFKDLPAVQREPFADVHDRPHLVMTTAADWAAVFPPIDDGVELSPPLVKQINTVKAKRADSHIWYFKLHKMVADEIDNSDLGADLTGIHYRTPNQVYLSNYGTPWEKAVLLRQILKHLKVPAEILAVAYGREPAEDVPTMFQVEQFLVKIAAGTGDAVYLDPVGSQDNLFPYPLAGKQVYNIDRRGFETLAETDWQQQGLYISGRLKAGTQKGEGELYVSLKGDFHPYLANMEDSRSVLQKTLSGILPVDKLEVKRMILLQPHECRAVVAVEGGFLKKLTEQTFGLEKFGLPRIRPETVGVKQWQRALHLKVPYQLSVDVQVEPADGLAYDFLAPETVVENELGHYRQQVKAAESGELTIHLTVGLKKPVIAPGEYPQLRSLLLPYLTPEPLAIFTKPR
jgi:hypothetical protein